MDFVKSHFWTKNLWPVEDFFGDHFFEHICYHFWVGLFLSPVRCNTHAPKSDDKYAQKSVQMVRGSSLRSNFIQNPYFSNTLWENWNVNKSKSTRWWVTTQVKSSFLHIIVTQNFNQCLYFDFRCSSLGLFQRLGRR